MTQISFVNFVIRNFLKTLIKTGVDNQLKFEKREVKEKRKNVRRSRRRKESKGTIEASITRLHDIVILFVHSLFLPRSSVKYSTIETTNKRSFDDIMM